MNTNYRNRRAKSTDFILTLHARDGTDGGQYDDPSITTKKSKWQKIYSIGILKKFNPSNDTDERYDKWKSLFSSPPTNTVLIASTKTNPSRSSRNSAQSSYRSSILTKGFSLDFKDLFSYNHRKSQTRQGEGASHLSQDETISNSATSSPIMRARKQIETALRKLAKSPKLPRFKNENKVSAINHTKPNDGSFGEPSSVVMSTVSTNSKSPMSPENLVQKKPSGGESPTFSTMMPSRSRESHLSIISFPKPSVAASSFVPEDIPFVLRASSPKSSYLASRHLTGARQSEQHSSGNKRLPQHISMSSNRSYRTHHTYSSSDANKTENNVFSPTSDIHTPVLMSSLPHSDTIVAGLSARTVDAPFTASPIENEDASAPNADVSHHSRGVGTGESSTKSMSPKARKRRHRKTRGMSAFVDVSARPSEDAIVQKIEEFFPQIEDFKVIEVPNVDPSMETDKSDPINLQRQSIMALLAKRTTLDPLKFNQRQRNENQSHRSTLLLLQKEEAAAAAPELLESGSEAIMNLKDIARNGIVANHQQRHLSLAAVTTGLTSISNDSTISRSQSGSVIRKPATSTSSHVSMGIGPSSRLSSPIGKSSGQRPNTEEIDIMDENNAYIKQYYQTDQFRNSNLLLPGSRPLSAYSIGSSHSSVIRATEVPVDGERQMIWYKGDLIGQGAYGSVFLGLDLNNWRLMAVKQVLNNDFGSLKGKKSSVMPKKSTLKGTAIALKQEMSLLKSIRHPHIVEYLGFEKTETETNVFLEYVPGGSIATVLMKTGPFPESLILPLSWQILSGIEYLHTRSIIHRDIKGANILLDNDGIAKISDFGISIQMEGIDKGISDPSVKGTVNWMAPEIVKSEVYGTKVDIWSFGCVVIEMLTGQKPWANLTLELQIFSKLLKGNIPSIPETTTSHLTAFIRLALECDPTKRLSAAELFRQPILQDIKAYGYPYKEFVKSASEKWRKHLMESMKDLSDDGSDSGSDDEDESDNSLYNDSQDD